MARKTHLKDVRSNFNNSLYSLMECGFVLSNSYDGDRFVLDLDELQPNEKFCLKCKRMM